MEKLNIGIVLKDAWKSFRRHYFTNVLIVFLTGIIVGGYALNTGGATLGNTQTFTTANETKKIMNHVTAQSNADILAEFIEGQELLTIQGDPEKTSRKYTEGVMSVFVNHTTSSGSLGFGILNGINTLLFKDKISQSAIVFIFACVLFLLNVFVKNIIEVGKCRYFLEHRRFVETSPDRLLFVYKHGKTLNVAKSMFLKTLFQTLWNVTIIGGIYKSYEYSLIPYIMAENPEIDWADAKKIARQLSKGNKRWMFLIDLLLLPGYIISPFTMNLLSVFMMDPLKECAYANIYMELRSIKASSVEKIRLLNDSVLDISDVIYESYPDDAYQLPILEKRKWIKIDYDRKYRMSTIILFFFSFSFVGWVWEVFYTVVDSGILANRGTMFGPWLPIYGFGGLIIIVGLKPLRDHPFILFVGTFIACGILEYTAAWGLETLFGVKWWDYTGFFLNIHGRVCLEGLFVFGLAGVAFTYIFAPLLDNLYNHIKPDLRKPICIVLLTLFAIDLAFSAFHPNQGSGITAGEADKPGKLQTSTEKVSEAA